MEKELFGIGKTWLGVYIMIILMAAMVFTGDLAVAEFLTRSAVFLGLGAGKSGLKKIGEGLKR